MNQWTSVKRTCISTPPWWSKFTKFTPPMVTHGVDAWFYDKHPWDEKPRAKIWDGHRPKVTMQPISAHRPKGAPKISRKAALSTRERAPKYMGRAILLTRMAIDRKMRNRISHNSSFHCNDELFCCDDKWMFAHHSLQKIWKSHEHRGLSARRIVGVWKNRACASARAYEVRRWIYLMKNRSKKTGAFQKVHQFSGAFHSH